MDEGEEDDDDEEEGGDEEEEEGEGKSGSLTYWASQVAVIGWFRQRSHFHALEELYRNTVNGQIIIRYTIKQNLICIVYGLRYTV